MATAALLLLDRVVQHTADVEHRVYDHGIGCRFGLKSENFAQWVKYLFYKKKLFYLQAF